MLIVVAVVAGATASPLAAQRVVALVAWVAAVVVVCLAQAQVLGPITSLLWMRPLLGNDMVKRVVEECWIWMLVTKIWPR